jgi:hypothetical protein
MVNNVLMFWAKCGCGQSVYCYPIELTLETVIPYIFNNKRIINFESECEKNLPLFKR